MSFADLPIKRKVTAVIMLTSVVALVLTAAAFILYDFITDRQALVRHLSATAARLAHNSVPALAARNEAEAVQLLAGLRANPDIAFAALYDSQDNLLARYPAQTSVGRFPLTPGTAGHRFQDGHLQVFEPVRQAEGALGTLFLQSDMRPVYERLRFYGGIMALGLCGSVLLTLILSNVLQRRVSDPILALATVAKIVSERHDYSVRAPQLSEDELGQLTQAFNQMLGRIQETEAARSFLAAIVQSSHDAIIGKDLKGRVVSWNQGAERIFGYSAAEMLGQSILRLILPERPEEEDQILRGAKQGQIRHFETIRRHKSGKPIQVSLTISPIRNAREEIIGVSSIARDITERKAAEQQIRQMNLKLEERVEARTQELTAANKELEAFTYSVAHDLRAPLRHIDAFGKILTEEFAAHLPPEARRYLETIRTGSHHMSQLVDDLLNLARVGRQDLKRQATSLNKLIEEVRAGLQPETEGRTIEWRLHPLPTLQCDPGLMKQVFANLLSNAVKYTRPRPRAIIEVGTLPGAGSLTLFVRDNGVGFNMKYVNKLFGVFQRLHRSDEFEGTGVGLATVERIIRKHGGCVWAEAALDKGAVFYFCLPTSRQEESKAAAELKVEGCRLQVGGGQEGANAKVDRNI